MKRWVDAHRLFCGWLLGLATTGLLAATVGALFLSGIAYNTGADRGHFKLLADAIHATMVHSVERRARADAVAPPVYDTAALLDGARLYQRHCLACHGGPGTAREHWVSAMLPTPPYLLDADRRWSHAALLRVVRSGVKMTGMPAWGEVLSERQIDEVVGFVKLLPRVSPAAFQRLMQAAQDDTAGEPMPSRGAVSMQREHLRRQAADRGRAGARSERNGRA